LRSDLLADNEPVRVPRLRGQAGRDNGPEPGKRGTLTKRLIERVARSPGGLLRERNEASRNFFAISRRTTDVFYCGEEVDM
jgi:hypothetical protein